VCLGHQLVDDAVIQPAGDHRCRELFRLGVVEALDEQLGEIGERVGRLASGEQQGNRLGQQPARDEAQRLRGGAVQPLRVVDDAQQRALLRGLGEKAQGRQGDEKAIRRRVGTHPEGDVERLALRSGKPIDEVVDRRAHLMQGRERELHLGLDAHRPQHREVRRRFDRVLEQRRLADASLPPQDQHTAPPAPRILEHPVQRRALVSPTAQHRDLGRGTRAGHGQNSAR
jgi:hypothetical protein